ncbi:MAG: AAA family ATPase [Prevotella sp.]|nr:AAA family ATPase [Candidatus Equicola faecalis]
MAKKQKSALNAEQEKVFASFRAGANIFLCGKGGSGKSYLTRYIIDDCKKRGLGVIVCARTGVAANNIGGATLHHTFKMPVRVIEPGRMCKDEKVLSILGKADVIIIDEISMVRIDEFEYIARTLLSLNPKKKLLVAGDFYQLPPVVGTNEKDVFHDLYGGKRYAFESDLWVKLQLQTMELQSSMRQSDKTYASSLDHIREGIPDFECFDTSKTPDPTAITLCGKREEVNQINEEHFKILRKQGAKPRKYKAIKTGIVESSDLPTDEELSLCAGAKVVMLNNDSDGRWVNGTFGEVASVDDDSIDVRIEGCPGTVNVPRFTWKFSDYEVKKTPEGIKLYTVERGSFEQFPVRLAWAITIHKSQGQTYDRVNANIRSIFENGQAYVALSRCRTLKGLTVIGTLTPEKIQPADAVKRFMSGDHRPDWSGPMLPLYEGEELSPKDGTYQEGWDDGYKQGTDDTEAKYQQRIIEDPGVKVLSEYTRRQKELSQIEDPEERNPKGAGRKKLPINEKKESKAIRVPGELADLLKEIGDLAKENPERIEQLKSQCTAIIETYR